MAISFAPIIQRQNQQNMLRARMQAMLGMAPRDDDPGFQERLALGGENALFPGVVLGSPAQEQMQRNLTHKRGLVGGRNMSLEEGLSQLVGPSAAFYGLQSGFPSQETQGPGSVPSGPPPQGFPVEEGSLINSYRDLFDSMLSSLPTGPEGVTGDVIQNQGTPQEIVHPGVPTAGRPLFGGAEVPVRFDPSSLGSAKESFNLLSNLLGGGTGTGSGTGGGGFAEWEFNETDPKKLQRSRWDAAHRSGWSPENLPEDMKPFKSFSAWSRSPEVFRTAYEQSAYNANRLGLPPLGDIGEYYGTFFGHDPQAATVESVATSYLGLQELYGDEKAMEQALEYHRIFGGKEFTKEEVLEAIPQLPSVIQEEASNLFAEQWLAAHPELAPGFAGVTQHFAGGGNLLSQLTPGR